MTKHECRMKSGARSTNQERAAARFSVWYNCFVTLACLQKRQFETRDFTRMTSAPVAWLNGRIVPIADAKVSIFDLGLVQGAAVTEMIRTFGHRPNVRIISV